MIASLTGELFHKSSDRLILDVGGVGYEVFCTEASLFQLPETGHEVFMHIYTDVRDDAINLYGFIDADEKKMFILLKSVSGVGPKLALNILSGIRPSEFSRTIASDDIVKLTRLPGVGKKTAERLCLELKDKVEFIPDSDAEETVTENISWEDERTADVISALVNLGYHRSNARSAIETVRAKLSDEEFAGLKLEELLRLSLRTLA